MGRNAARQGDRVSGQDTHTVMVPNPAGGEIPTPMPMPFSGAVVEGCPSVLIEGRPAAVVGSTVKNVPGHVAPYRFMMPPSNQGKVSGGSPTVTFGGKAAARDGDTVMTCNDGGPQPRGRITATCTVQIG
ncbi:PAAR domain-containing protein [Streptomyces vinaceus]|uniref:PAAR domain-containing protein n=1 Tax=Streptomyces vinaceus TaxID=1960 RepID=UPI00381D339C